MQRLIEDDLVKVNGKPTKASYKIKAGDLVEMVAPPEPVNDLIPEPIPLDIVYEDEHFLALNKQAGSDGASGPGKMVGNAGQRAGVLRAEVEHDQRGMAAGNSASAGPEHDRDHAGGQER